MGSIAYGAKLDPGKLPKCFSLAPGGTIFPLPLSDSDSIKLKSLAPKLGSAPAWEIPASTISFPENGEFLSHTLQQLVDSATAHLQGFSDLKNVRAHFHKLVMYDVGMSFEVDDRRRDHATRFGTMILQLPIQSVSKGGRILIRKQQASETLVPTGFYLAAFVADSEYELTEVLEGLSLCLVFSMERFTLGPGIHHQFGARFTALGNSINTWITGLVNDQPRESSEFPSKVLLLLQGSYSQVSSVSEMLRADRILIDAVALMAGEQGESFELYLCTLRKTVGKNSPAIFSIPEESWGSLRGFDCVQLGKFDHPMSVELHSEVWMLGKDQVFDENVDVLCKIDSSTVCYETLVLVLVPRSRKLYFDSHRELSGALSSAPDEPGMQQVFSFLRERNSGVNGDHLKMDPESETRLLTQCRSLGYDHLVRGVELLRSIRNIPSSDVLFEVIQQHGWSKALESALEKIEAIEDRKPLAHLAVKLKERGQSEAAAAVVRKLNLGDPKLQEFLNSLLDDAQDKAPPGILESLIGDDRVADRLTLELLIENRMEKLMRPENPREYWCQTRASFPFPHVEVRDFFKGPAQEFVYGGFSSQAEVKEFVKNYFETRDFVGSFNKKLRFSAEAKVGVGTGVKDPFCCIITKTREACDVLRPEFQILQLQKLRLSLVKQRLEKNGGGKKQRLW